MYTAHFGLTEPPFSLTPDPRYVYMSERHREALAHLLYGIGQGDGFVQLTGDVGTGKTTMCRCLLEQLPPDVDAALIFNPRLTSHELLATVMDELRLPTPSGPASVKQQVDGLYRHLLAAHEKGRRTVLIIDEAQNLAPDVLEQVRLLTNLETARDKLLQIILIGQPELIALLERRELRQLAQRVKARYHLRPFTRDETRSYVLYRLAVAGGTRPIFSARALSEVHRLAGGVPRRINVICDRALLGAYASGQPRIAARTVRRAAREIRGVVSHSRRPWRWAAVAVVGAAVAALVVAADRFAWLGPAPAAVEEPAPTAVATSADDPSAAAPVIEPRLESVLADTALPTGERAAFAVLYARWGLEYPPNHRSSPCDFGRPAGFRCLTGTGTWGRLRRLDLPAVLELRTPNGRTHFATLAALDEQKATLEFGGRQLMLPLSEIDRHWNGTFALLWYAPLQNTLLRPGRRGRDVEWVRQRLSELEGLPPVRVTAPDVYDAGLVSQVKAFQANRLLVPDGIAGEETLAHLSAAARGPGTPGLMRP